MADPKAALKAMTTALEALEPLDGVERQRAMAWLSETLEVSAPTPPTPPTPQQVGGSTPAPPSPPAGGGNGGDAIQESPKEFLARKQPTTDVERLTCLAYYLTKARDTSEFKTADLTTLNTEAAGRRFANAANTGKNAVGQNSYLTGAAGRKRQITHLGEQVVDAMPDREAVKAVIAASPNRPKRRKSKAKKASK